MKHCYNIPEEKILLHNKEGKPDTNTQETKYFLTYIFTNWLFD